MNHTALVALASAVIDADDDRYDLHFRDPLGLGIAQAMRAAMRSTVEGDGSGSTADYGIGHTPDELGAALAYAVEYLGLVAELTGAGSSTHAMLSANVSMLAGRYLAACHAEGVAA